MLDFADRTGSSIFMEVWPQIIIGFLFVLYTDRRPTIPVHEPYYVDSQLISLKLKIPTLEIQTQIPLHFRHNAVQSRVR